MRINKDLEEDISVKKSDLEDPDTIRKRNESKELTILFQIKRIVIYLVSVELIVIFLVYVLHLIIPIKFRWLSIEEIEKIRSIAVSIIVGIMSSLIPMFFFKR